MKNIFKKIFPYILAVSITFTSCAFTFNMLCKASVLGTVSTIVGVVSETVGVIDTVNSWVNGGSQSVSRETYYPNANFNYSPTNVEVKGGYTYNYYTIDDSVNSTLVNNYTYTPTSYYNWQTNNYTTTNNVSNYNTENYTTYNYDDNTYITEYYNAISYTYINPSTNTVDCYICAFRMPSGDSSFNYSENYCKGLYWSYEVGNYSASYDTDNLLALFRLDGDLSNEVEDSDIVLRYNGSEYSDGKFDSCLKFTGTYDMYLCRSNGSDIGTQYTMDYWHYNGDTNYTAIPIGWHYYYYTFDNGTVTLWIDGIQTRKETVASNIGYSSSGSTFYQGSNGSLTAGTITTGEYSLQFSFYNPCDYSQMPSVADCYLSNGTLNFNDLNLSKLTLGEDVYKFCNGTYSGYGMDSPSPLHYPPTFSSDKVIFDYTGSQSAFYSNTYYRASHNFKYYYITGEMYKISGSSTVYLKNTYTYNNWDCALASNLDSLGIYYTNGTSNNYVGTSNRYATKYDLSDCYADEIRVRSGVIPYTSTPTSRQEFGVTWVAPTGAHTNDIAIQSAYPVNGYRIGGVIPTVPFDGMVWFNLDEGYCTECLQYQNGSWQYVNFGVYNGSEWKNGYKFNFYDMTINDVDADTGTNSTTIINNYYEGDTVNYFGDSVSTGDKSTLNSFFSMFIGLLTSAFVALATTLSGALWFLPAWCSGLFIALLPILSILCIVKLTKKFISS